MKLDGLLLPDNLQALVLNRTDAGWQAIASFLSVEKWNVTTGADPVQCVRDVLSGRCDFHDPRGVVQQMKPSIGAPRREAPKPAPGLFD